MSQTQTDPTRPATPDDTAAPPETAATNAAAAPGPAETPDHAAELAAMRDKWLRAEAEMQNLRNRHKRELEDARNYGLQKFARDMADAAENLRRGLDALPPTRDGEDPLLGKLRDGFESAERALVSALERHGVHQVNPVGKPFDPDQHQAMAEQPATSDFPPGTIITAWTPAWTLNGRLLKPAMVVVAGKPG
ncbi:nucleotide exchange factor GrpE [Muricoccus radiodurans]|uniref:nucleotide exchange factor GrpE n=1 Tax=Muricoccus radiodurans TaxID=2231721 RepID=UPI003CF92802